MRTRERGTALILALATLLLLASLALVMWTGVRLGRDAALGNVDGRHATLAAEAGLHRAVAELTDTFTEPLTGSAPAWSYIDSTGDFALGVPIVNARQIS